MVKYLNIENSSGFTLIEAILAVAIFAIISTGIYFSYSNVLDIFSASYLNLTAISALDNELETVKNMPYDKIGTQGGIPSGDLLSQRDLTYGNVPFVVNTYVRNVDDPFDGTQGGNPSDTSPADYKLVEIEITCPSCPRFIPAKATTTISPAGLETITNNGTLIIKVLNASGQPIAGANVAVTNTILNPDISINDVTDSAGVLKLLDVPPSTGGYHIVITKSGYSSDQTYPPGGQSNPNPLKPDVTVLAQQVTETSFVIDRVSTLNMRTQNEFCGDVGNIDFLQTGQKLIGTNPNVLKYSASHTTDSTGDIAVSGLEFDTYNFQNQDAVYEVRGFSPLMPVAVDPNGTYNLTWLMVAKNPSVILVTVKDKNTGQLVNDANVGLTKSGFSDNKYTGRFSLAHTDWSGGQYDSKSDYLSVATAGELRLGQINGKYASTSDQWLVSQTIDFGASDTTFYNLNLTFTQPAQTTIRVQVAANNDNSTWNFVGPDGTSNTYYTASSTQLHSSHNNNRYLRYKVILRTDNHDNTPSLQDLTLNFHSSCTLDGQAYFSGLSQATYRVTVTKSGYKNFTDNSVQLNSNWKDYRVTLEPQ
jgi:prepilin-type N-terminal cleavage/methylation domain-containing protein